MSRFSLSKWIRSFNPATKSRTQRKKPSRLPRLAASSESLENRTLLTIEPFTVPLSSLKPDGSLIYGGTQNASFDTEGESDGFTIELDAGQKLSAFLTATDGSIQAQLSVVDPFGNPIATSSASAAGETVLVQSVTVADAGTYRIDTTSIAGSGLYSLNLLLNADFEEETLSAASNDDASLAQNIDASAVSLGSGDRLAVTGHTEGGLDYYSFTLAPGQEIALSAASHDGSHLSIELYDDLGNLLARGFRGGQSAADHISGFVSDSGGTYFAVVTGAGEFDYSLVIGRDATLDDLGYFSQNISGTQLAVGHLHPTSVAQNGTMRVAVHTGSYGGYVVDQLNDDTYFDFEAVPVIGEEIDTIDELLNYDVVVIADYTLEYEISSFSPALRQWVESGGAVVGAGWLIYAAGLSTGSPDADIDAIIPVNTTDYYDYYYQPTIVVENSFHPVTQGVSDFQANDYAELAHGEIDPGAEVLATMNGEPAVVVGTPGGAGRSVWLAPVYMGGGGYTTGIADQLLEQAVAWAARSDSQDQYFFDANSGDLVSISATIPFSGSGEPQNELTAPVIRLFNPSGDLVASYDPANPEDTSPVEYLVPADAAGRYRVLLTSNSTSGTYVLSVTGATGDSQPLTITGTSTFDGQLRQDYVFEYDVHFSEPLLLSSIDAFDLSINGNPADSFTILDADSVRFFTNSSYFGDGSYFLTIGSSGIASLAGQILDPVSTEFTVDSIGPQVIESSLYDWSVIAQGDFFVDITLSEPLGDYGLGNYDFLGVEDVALYDSITFEYFAANSFVYDQFQNKITIGYSTLPQGEYILELYSGDIFDLVGNHLDGYPSFPLPSGDGFSGDSFYINFSVDIDTASFPVPMQALSPLGSLVYESTASGRFNSVLDTDSFTLELDPGQTLSVVLSGLGESFQGRIEIFGPDSSLVAARDAGTFDEPVSLDTVAIADGGIYTISVTSLAGFGDYSLRAVLNAALEDEGIFQGANDRPIDAEDLSASFTDLGSGASRASVLGAADGRLNIAHGGEVSVVAGDVLGGDLQSIVDSVFLPRGNEWTTDTVYWQGEEMVLEVDLGGQYVINSARIQADNNDAYRLEYRDVVDGLWKTLWDIPNYADRGIGGMITRPDYPTSDDAEWQALSAVSADKVRVYAVSGDGAYSISELQLGGSAVGSGAPESGDYYAVELTAGQPSSFVLGGSSDSDLGLELLNSAGVTLAVGANTATNAAAHIQPFVPTVTGTYYVRITGDAGAPYNLTVLRNAVFNIEPSSDPAHAIELGKATVVLGSVHSGIGITAGDNSVALSTTLLDASGYIWDIQRDGNINNGTSDAYDGGLIHLGFPNFNTGTTEDAGREITIGPANMGDFEVRRKIYVPEDQSFARFLEIVTNQGTTELTYLVQIYTDLGSDGNEQFIYSSSGDGVIDTADNWAITDDSNGSGDPTLIFVAAGDNGRVRPSLFRRLPNQVQYNFELTLQPGESQIVMHFAAQNQNRAVALEKAPLLGNLELDALEGLSPEERSLIVNFESDPIEDHYTFSALDGDHLVLTTATPGDGSGEPSSLPDIVLDLYAPDGTLVASNDNGAPDGRNALLEYVVPEGALGSYRVVVRSTGTAGGNYVLEVTGATGATALFEVIGSTPNDGAQVAGFPSVYRIDMSQSILLTSVQPEDLTVDGVSASFVNVIDHNTLEFGIANAVHGDGIYTVTIAAGALTSVVGTPVEEFTATFDADATMPVVISSSLDEGDTIEVGSLVYEAQFSEALQAAILGTEDVVLQNTATGVFLAPTAFNYDGLTHTITASFAGLTEGQYVLTLRSTVNGFRDLAGNLLDGNPSFPLPSGDGVAGGDFAVHFNVDAGTRAVAVPLPARTPLGSLIYQASQGGYITPGGDSDAFTLDVEAGQLISFAAYPTQSSFRPEVDLVSPSGVVVATNAAPANGAGAAVQAHLTTEAGVYRLVVRGFEGSVGGYNSVVALNALLEAEALTGESNGTAGSAEDLGPSLMELSDGVSRFAVSGNSAGEDDFYHFSLPLGQYATIALVPQSGAVSAFEIQDIGGTVLAQGVLDEGGSQFRIANFVSSGGVYVVRVHGTASTYNLAVVGGASLDLEPNDDINRPQQLEGPLRAIGGLEGAANFYADFSDSAGALSLDGFAATGLWHVTNQAGGNLAGHSGPNMAYFGSDASLNFNFGNVAGTLTSAPLSLRADSAPQLTFNYRFQGESGLTWDRAEVRVSTNNGQSYTTVANKSTHIAQTLAWTSTTVDLTAYAGQTILLQFSFASGDGVANDGLGWQVDDIQLTGVTDLTDYYSFDANAGDQLFLRTRTPGDAAGEPQNSFDPILDLFDPAGQPVATDDNGADGDDRNASISYTALTTGTYRVRVRGSNGGAYQLSIDGSTASNLEAPFVSGVVPASGAPLAAAPDSVIVTFSEAIRSDSIQATDLVFSTAGVSVTGFQQLEGNRVRFDISIPDASGTYEYTIGAGAVVDLQGLANTSFAGSIYVDRFGPYVTSTNPLLQTSAPFTQVTFVFNETVNRDSLSTNDVTSFTGPGGVSLISSLQDVLVNGNEVTFRFSQQLTAGTYSMSLGPNIEDLVGNRLDQNQDGTADGYTVTLQLQSPDLVPSNVVVPGVAVFGQLLDLSYLVRNIGSDPALEGWLDGIFLSTDQILDRDDRRLVNLPSTGTNGPLDANGAPDDRYSKNYQVLLPLDMNTNSGTFYVLVEADTGRRQPESSETNNVAASGAVNISLPPLPDLVVSNIVAPIEALSGQTIEISWTITNQGTSDFTGNLGDSVFLSSDAAVGNDQFYQTFAAVTTIPAGGSLTRTQRITLPINLEGDRYVVIQTEGFNSAFEHNGENNNTTIDTEVMTVRLAPLPNLRVTSVTPPSTAFSSQQTVVEWVVKNVGTGATNASIWYDFVYLSTDDILDDQDVYLGNTPNSSYLNVDESYQNSLAVTLPRGIDGDYRFIVLTDGHNHVYEHNSEGDNSRAGSVTDVQLTPPPDLQVTNVNAPSQAFSGQKVNLSWTVTNEGPGETLEAAWNDSIYMSLDNILDGSDRFLGSRQHSGRLSPDESYTTPSTEFNLPIGVDGDYFIFVVTDAFNQAYEHAFEGNNSGFDATPMHINLTPPPDLVVTSVSAPATALANHILTVNYSVANEGATETPNSSWTDHLYLSADTNFNPHTDIALGTVGHYGKLQPGEDYQGTFNALLPQTLSGSFYVYVLSDRAEQVFELDRTNNFGRDSDPVQVDFRPPDLVVNQLTAPAVADAGSTILMSYTVANIGTGDTVASSWNDSLYLSTDSTFGNGDEIRLHVVSHAGVVASGGTYSNNNVLVTIPLTVASGNYHLFLVTDADNHVFEHNSNGNNISLASSITITQTTADLQVSSITPSSTTLQSGDQLTVNWRVQNFGSVATNATYWNDQVYLSTDGDFGDGDDIYLGSLQHNSNLGGNSFYDASRTFTLPASLQGTFYVFVSTDSDQRVVEGPFEGNNVASALQTVEVTLRPAPDLRVTNVDAPLSAFAGQKFDLTWAVKNFGPGSATGSWYDAFYLSLDQTLDNTDTYVGYANRPNNLGANVSYTNSASLSIPQGLGGAFYVFVRTDAGNQIDERGFENNNLAFDGQSMQINLLPPADLVVGTIEIPDTGVPGRDITIGYTINNEGSNPAIGSWTDALYFSLDDQWDVNDLLIGRVNVSANVAGGSGYSRELTAPAPGVNPGLYHVIIRSDIRNHLPELNEANNLSASLDRVELDAEVLEFDVPDVYDLASGHSAYYKIQIPAGETARFILDSVSDDADTEVYVRYGSMPSRTTFDFAASEPFQADQTLTIPANQTGTYYVLVYRRSVSGSPTYSLTANLVPFSISEVNATAGGDTGEFTVKIEGAKFQQGTEFELISQDGQNTVYSAVAKMVKDSTTAYVTFDLTFAEIGQYTLLARNGTLTTTLSSPFLIQTSTGGNVITFIEAASTLRPGRAYSFQLFYANDGNQDAAAPLLLVESPSGAPMGLSASSQVAGVPLQILGASPDGPLDVLRPGAQSSIFVSFSTGTVQQGVDIQVRAIRASDTSEITDTEWSFIEASVRPVGISDESWANFWAGIRPRIGTTWGEYVAFLNRLQVELAQPGHPIRDVKALFAALHAADPDYRPSFSISGQLLDSVSEAPKGGLEIGAYRRVGSAYFYAGKSVTDASGNFRFPYLVPGVYDFALFDELNGFDIDRDTVIDDALASYTVADDATGIVFHVAPVVVETIEGLDESPVLTQDGDGNVHMVWLQNGYLWHAVNRGSGFVEAQQVRSAFGIDPRLHWSPNLIDGTDPGLMVTWQAGEGNEAELYYAIGRLDASEGTYEWSLPVRITNDDVYDGAYDFTIGSNGLPVFVFQKQNFDNDDEDIDNYSWSGVPVAVFNVPEIDALENAIREFEDELDALDTSHRIRFQYGLGKFKIPVIGTSFEGGLRFDVTIRVGCEPRGTIEGALRIKFDLVKSAAAEAGLEIQGGANGGLRWIANRKTCQWEFKGGQLGFNVQGAVEVKFPLPPVTGPFAGTMVGPRLEVSYNGRAIYEENSSFPFGPSSTEGTGRIGIGLVAERKLDLWFFGEIKGLIRVIGNVNFENKKNGWELRRPNWGSVSILVRAEWETAAGRKHFWEYTFTWPADDGSFGQEALDVSSLFPLDGPLTLPEGGTFGVTDAALGALTDYSGNGVESISQDLGLDSQPDLGQTVDGLVYTAWASTDGVELRSYDSSTGEWGAQKVIPGTSTMMNTSVAIEADGDGDFVTVWSARQDPGLTSSSTQQEFLDDVLEGGDLFYSVYDAQTDTFTSPLPLFALLGSDDNVSLTRDRDGNLIATWLHASADGTSILYSSAWDADSDAWSTEQVVRTTSNRIVGSATITTINNQLVAMWTESPSTAITITQGARSIIRSATFDGSIWSSATDFSYTALPQPEALATADVPLEALFFPPFPVPEDCCDCKLKEPPPPPECGTYQTLDKEKCEYVSHYKPCVVQPRDPNDIVNPAGFGEEHWITAEDKIPYQIRFENAADASAPAQVVTITQTLDPDLNPSSFRLGSFGFDNLIFEVPANRAFYSTLLDLTETHGYFVDVAMGINIATRQVFFTMTTIDPETGEVPLDADVGFLPVNNELGRGEGFVSYTIKARTTVTTGTRIDAGFVDDDNDFRASIVFDTEGPILTPSVFNTLDADKPVSSVNALPSSVDANSFEVSWTGTDSDNGSGLAYYNIFVSIDGDTFEPWLENTQLTQATYSGEAGHTYAFFSVATDNAGNVENDPAVADTQTATPGGLASIGDFVWHDSNGDGVQGASESGLEGVTVTLHSAADDSILATTVTDADGAYEFAGLELTSVYYVQFELLTGYAFSPTGQSADPGLDSDANIVTGRTASFTPLNGANTEWDAGMFLLGSISGTIWDDVDGDGLKDTNEGYLSDWGVYLDSNDNGQYDASLNEPYVRTDLNGAYSFAGLRPGLYVVAQELPGGWEQTFPGPAGSSATNSAGFHRTYTFSGSTTELAAPNEVIVNTALSTVDCGCRHTTDTTGGTVDGSHEYHPWAELIDLDEYRADPQFANVDGHGSTVVIIDTGIDLNHAFFGPDSDGDGIADRIVYQWDFADRDSDATDRTGHGSHVSSIIGSSDSRYAGLAPGADIISLKVFGDNGRGYFSYVEQALDWVIQHAAQYNIVAINLSVGDGQNWNSPIVMHGLGDELATLAGMDVITVAAAGNNYAVYESQGLSYPAADPNTLSVGAVWDGDRGGPWSFGSLGTDYTTADNRITSFSQRDGNDLDIFAVGAVVGGANATGGVAWLRGTSMATPQVTGAVVLAQQIAESQLGRRLSMSEIRTLIRTSGVMIMDGDDEDDSVRNSGITSYRLDVHAFAQAVLAYDGSLQNGDPNDPGDDDDQGGGGTGPQAGRPYRFSVTLAAEENRADVNFGARIIDDLAPTSSVAALPAFTGTDFTVSWSGTDEGGGSGLAYFDIYVSDNDGEYSVWKQHTTDTSALFSGVDGHTYKFYSVAIDRQNNAEDPPADPDTQTTVDASAPTSSVAVLPEFSNQQFDVTWNGTDGSGSGIASFNVYVSDNDGPFTLLLENTTETSVTFNGQIGHTYEFYSVAKDNLGQIEAAPTDPDAITKVQSRAPEILDQLFSIDENSGSSSILGSVDAFDPDTGDSLTFAITGGNAAGSFAIDPFTGELTIANSSALDYETNPQFLLSIEVTDEYGLSDTATVTVNLGDVNEGPSIDANQAFSVAENSAASTVVGTVAASDPDMSSPNNALSYSITGGNIGNAFAIDSLTGQISVLTSSALDFETQPVFQLTVKVTDGGGLADSKTVTINLTDVAEGPVLTGYQLQKGQAQRSFIRYIDLTFGSAAGLDALISSGRIRLKRFDLLSTKDTDGSNMLSTNAVNVSLNNVVKRTNNQLKFDFGANGVGGGFNSIAGDGYYTLELDLNGDGVFETAKSFYRLLGDANGDRTVDQTDYDLVRANLGQLNSPYDLNGDGKVDTADLLHTQRSRGRRIGNVVLHPNF